MTEAGSSSSATFGKQDTGDLAPSPLPRRYRFPDPVPEEPDEISELVRESVGWDTIVDRRNAQIRYLFISQGEEYPDLNIEDELAKLKGLSSALESKHDNYKKECEEVQLKYENILPQLVKELVEKVPNIKVMPGYEHLTSMSEKYEIEKALKKQVPEVELQDEDALAKHLKDFRAPRLPLTIQLGKLYGQLRKIDSLRWDVNNFIQILTAKQSRLDNQVSDVKRKKPESPTKNMEKLEVWKEVEEGLFKVQREVGKPNIKKNLKRSAIDDEFNKKWDSIVDNLTNLLKEANAVVSDVVGDKKRKQPERQTAVKKRKQPERRTKNRRKFGDKVTKFPECPTKNRKKLGKVQVGLLTVLRDGLINVHKVLRREVDRSSLKSSAVDSDQFSEEWDRIMYEFGDMFGAVKHDILYNAVVSEVEVVPESPSKNRGEVEDGLLEMLKEVGGPTFKCSVVDTDEFREKWGNIVNAFTDFLDCYFC